MNTLVRRAADRVLGEGTAAPSWRVLLPALLLIAGWQLHLSDPSSRREDQGRITAGTGIHQEARFYFFWHHLGGSPPV